MLFFKTSPCPAPAALGWFGQLFLSYGFLAYLAIIIALGASYFLNHTRPGLHLRAVGESASTADAAGINVTKYKYLATCIGCMIAGLGGLYYVMDYASGVWSNNAFGDRGWLAIALVIFTIWRPNVSILASILFGGLYIIYIYLSTTGWSDGCQGAVQDAALRGHSGGADRRLACARSGRISLLQAWASPTSARNADPDTKKSRSLCGLLFFPTYFNRKEDAICLPCC